MDYVDELGIQLYWLEDTVASRVPGSLAKSTAIQPLRDLYATRSAGAILRCVQAAFPPDSLLLPQRGAPPIHWPAVTALPRPERIHRWAAKLRVAVSLGDVSKALEALISLGVLDLFPSPEAAVARLENVVRHLCGAIRMLPLVELAVFATEVGIYDRAADYVAEAKTLRPETGELHDLCTVIGVIAVAEGRINDAVEELMKSVSVLDDDNESSHDGCFVRGLNLMLARKLLDLGQTGAVLQFLTLCSRLWQHDHINVRINRWIAEIGATRKPNLVWTSSLLRPSERIILLATETELRRI